MKTRLANPTVDHAEELSPLQRRQVQAVRGYHAKQIRSPCKAEGHLVKTPGSLLHATADQVGRDLLHDRLRQSSHVSDPKWMRRCPHLKIRTTPRNNTRKHVFHQIMTQGTPRTGNIQTGIPNAGIFGRGEWGEPPVCPRCSAESCEARWFMAGCKAPKEIGASRH